MADKEDKYAGGGSISEEVCTYGIYFLIIVSLVTFSIDTLPDLSANMKNILNVIELFTVCVFTFEYVARLVLSERKLRFVCSFYGLIDLCAILPFYLTVGLDLRSIRVFRVIRLVRILKLCKYTQAINRLQRAFILAKEELILFGFFSVIVLYLSAVGIYYCEHSAQPEQFKSVFHSLWWALITLTTVGYGDMYPITVGGKICTFFVLIIGLGVVAIPTGLMSSALLSVRRDSEG